MGKSKRNKSTYAEQQVRTQKKLVGKQAPFSARTDFWIILAFLGLTVILFHGIFSLDNTIVSSDFNVWGANYLAQHIREFTWQKWLPYDRAGTDWPAGLYPTYLLLFFMPPQFWIGFNYALHVFLLGTFMYLWMRYLNLNRIASVFAGVCMMFTNHVVTLAFPGHMGKFHTFAWAPLTFYFFTKGVKEKKIYLFIFAGCFYGLQILGGELQVAYYLGICLFLYLSYLLFWEFKQTKRIRPILKSIGGFIVMAVVTGVFAAQAILYFFGFQQTLETAFAEKKKPAASVSVDKQTPQRDGDSGYEFNTSWSFPPEEILTFFMQRPFGDYTGASDDKEYWGRLGSKNMKLKLTDDYMGIIPLLFVGMALYFVRKRDTVFWAALGAIALLFSFGGFTPIYKYILLIPGMIKFRDPNKWIFIVTFCVAILAGYGMQWYSSYHVKNKIQDKQVKYLAYTLFTICGFSILLTLFGTFFRETIVEHIMSALSQHRASLDYSMVLARYDVIFSGFVRMTILLIVVAALILAGFKLMDKKNQFRYILIIIIALTATDLGLSASRFLQYQDYRETYRLDPITAFLKNDTSYYRVKLYSRHPLLSQLSEFKFRYYEIPAWDLAASRLPKLYNNFLTQIAENFGTFLDVGNIKYMLGDRPLTHPLFRQVYDVGGFFVYQYLGFVPRVFTISKFQVIPDEEQVIQIMKKPEFNLRNGVIVETDPGIISSATTDYNPTGAEIISYHPNQVTIRAQVDKPSLLVFHDYYTSDWKAFVDSKSTVILKTNYLMRSVVLPAGTHSVVFRYEPNMVGFYISCFCLILLAVYLFYFGWRKWRANSYTIW